MDYLIFKEKAAGSLGLAETAFENREYNGCVNRSYYAMYQITIALFLFDNRIKNYRISHEKLISLFVQSYCSKTKIFAQLRSDLGDIQLKRNIADYENRHMNKKTAGRALKKSTNFVQTIIRSLENK